MKQETVINVTKTYLPSKDKYKSYIDKIYNSGWVTNNGSLVNELTIKLEQFLGVKNLILVSNGTLALQIAYKLLDLKGEVITTPFSFVATTSSLVWEGLTPIFVDIDKDSFCIDFKKIEEKITSNTTAILPVHVFGNSCEVEKIEEIASKYNLKIIYDAAHAFGVNYKGESLLNYGDVSILSFHATKIFHTIEGGALIIKDNKMYEKAKEMINFGIIGPDKINGIGINAKMNEFQAAMGLCVLEDTHSILNKRKKVFNNYIKALKKVENIQLQHRNGNCNNNFSYFPVIFKDENTLINVKRELEKNSIIPRRYFYPSLDRLDYIESEFMCISNEVVQRILCLPIYEDLSDYHLEKIIKIIKKNI